jgi:N-acyl-D-amino-acid deacylase
MRKNLLLLFPLAAALCWGQAYDLLITNALIIDGAGNPSYRGSVAVRGDTIAALGPLVQGAARRTIDAGGKVVAPGFIDIHTHARRGIFDRPTAENYIRQGVTTLIEGPDGNSHYPLREFFEQVAARRTTVNMGSMVGQGTVRTQVLGLVNRKATPAEIEKMRQIVRQEMESGALGLSTGLFYIPGNYTPTEEVVEIAKVVGQLGGIHVSHMRDENEFVLQSVLETIEIGEKGLLPTQVTHHKIVGTPNWGKSADTLKVIEAARERGVDVTVDLYPYTASGGSLTSLVPQWAQEGGIPELQKRLKDPATRARIKAGIVENIHVGRGAGSPRNAFISTCPTLVQNNGKNLAQLTDERGQDPTPENAAETLMGLLAQENCRTVYHAANEGDVERVMRYSWTMIASDGEIPADMKAVIHPRSYGTFARVLGAYVRDKKILTLEDAIRKMSSLPAQRLRLFDRGLLRPGMKADLAIFDPATVNARSEFGKPHQMAVGFSHVVVNGELVIDEGKLTEARPGRILKGAAARN